MDDLARELPIDPYVVRRRTMTAPCDPVLVTDASEANDPRLTGYGLDQCLDLAEHRTAGRRDGE